MKKTAAALLWATLVALPCTTGALAYADSYDDYNNPFEPGDPDGGAFDLEDAANDNTGESEKEAAIEAAIQRELLALAKKNVPGFVRTSSTLWLEPFSYNRGRIAAGLAAVSANDRARFIAASYSDICIVSGNGETNNCPSATAVSQRKGLAIEVNNVLEKQAELRRQVIDQGISDCKKIADLAEGLGFVMMIGGAVISPYQPIAGGTVAVVGVGFQGAAWAMQFFACETIVENMAGD